MGQSVATASLAPAGGGNGIPDMVHSVYIFHLNAHGPIPPTCWVKLSLNLEEHGHSHQTINVYNIITVCNELHYGHVIFVWSEFCHLVSVQPGKLLTDGAAKFTSAQ